MKNKNMNIKNRILASLGIVLILSQLVVPALAADNNTSGLLQKGSSEKFYNTLNGETKQQVDWVTSGVSFFFKWGAIIALLIGGLYILLARRKHNSHEESEGMESLIKIIAIVVIVAVAIPLVGQIFGY